jgi:hypothetical protein
MQGVLLVSSRYKGRPRGLRGRRGHSPPNDRTGKEASAAATKAQCIFVVADLEHLPLRERSFGFMVSNSVLHDTRLKVTLPGLRCLV